MDLVKLGVSEWMDILASESGAPGGGSASALAGAQGAALLAMAARLSLKKKDLEAHHPLLKDCLARLEKVRETLLEMVNLDSLAFESVNFVFTMPKNSDEEKKERREAMQSALKNCTEAPLRTMQEALSALKIGKEMLGKTNPNVRSDYLCGVLNLLAGLRGANENVRINLDGIKDEFFTSEKKSEADFILERASELEKLLT